MSNVQAIIVTWNKKNDVICLLDQLKNINYPKSKLEITVVDNNSDDGTVEAVESGFPRVKLIRNRENLGGAGGFNTGMRWVMENRPDAEYLWLLDNDVLVDRNALKELVAVMEKTPQAGICGSKIMDIDNRHEMIELGAFIDYNAGDVRRNMPPPEALQNPESVFEVDYVAACSLLARGRLVKKLGIWHEKFFIYWDDMEWGARFNAAGYKVLASNASLVYHPSWAGRVADTAAIWRNYYRTRNSLWFYNNYCSGIRRRLLLIKMITRFMKIATYTSLVYETALSQAYVRGVRDFFINNYGKKEFSLPFGNVEEYLSSKKGNACVFIHDSGTSETGKKFVSDLVKKYPETRTLAVVPHGEEYKWRKLCDKGDIVTYTRMENGRIPWSDKYEIMKFLKNSSWDVLLTSHEVPRMGAIWGKDIARTDFERGDTIASVEKMSLKHLCLIPIAALSFWIQALFCPPRKELEK